MLLGAVYKLTLLLLLLFIYTKVMKDVDLQRTWRTMRQLRHWLYEVPSVTSPLNTPRRRTWFDWRWVTSRSISSWLTTLSRWTNGSPRSSSMPVSLRTSLSLNVRVYYIFVWCWSMATAHLVQLTWWCGVWVLYCFIHSCMLLNHKFPTFSLPEK